MLLVCWAAKSSEFLRRSHAGTARSAPSSLLLVLIAFVLFLPAAVAQETRLSGSSRLLGRRILAVLQTKSAQKAHWGIQVTSVADGKQLVGWNADKRFVPASTAKLFTLASALVRLGPQFTYRTTVESAGAIDQNGALQGDLVLIGRGDPNLSGRVMPYNGKTERTDPASRVFQELADQVLARGVRTIAGDLVADDTYFVQQPYGRGWEVDDLLWWYGTPVTALTVNDNILFLSILPGASAGEPATIRMEPMTGYYEVDNRVLTIPRMQEVPGGGTVLAERRLTVDRRPGSTVLRLWGEIPENNPGWMGALAIEDPPRFAGELFRQELARRGVAVTGRVRVRELLPAEVADLKGIPTPPPTPVTNVLARFASAPLLESLKIISKVSQNLHAEMLLRTLGRERRNVGSVEAGLEEVSQFLQEAGIPAEDVLLRDGSGLSRQNLVTPQAMVNLLRFLYQSEHSAVWTALLPVGGTDGTLASRLRSRSVAGRVWAKTGNLTGVSALAGYVSNRKDHLLAFTIFVNNHDLTSAEVTTLIDRIVEEIARSG